MTSPSEHEALAEALGLEATDLDPAEIDLTLLARTPAGFLLRRRAIPLREVDGSLVVAFAGRPEPGDLAFPRRVFAMPVEPRIAPRARIEAACAAIRRTAARGRTRATRRSTTWFSVESPARARGRSIALGALLLLAWAVLSNRVLFAWFEHQGPGANALAQPDPRDD